MQRQPVRSSDLKSVGFDAPSQTLKIEFHSGGVYQYRAVPQAIYDALMNASSKGTYFHLHIKERYAYARIH